MALVKRALVLILLTQIGCGHIYAKHSIVHRMEQVASDHELVCYLIDNKQVAWSAVNIVTAALSGGSATVTAIVDDRTIQISLTVSALVFTALSALSTYMQTHYLKQYNDACSK